MEGSRFSCKFVSNLSIKCEKENKKKKSDWLRYKNSVINPKNLDNRCFQYAFALTQHYKEIKNHSKRVSNLKPFVDIYN